MFLSLKQLSKAHVASTSHMKTVFLLEFSLGDGGKASRLGFIFLQYP